MRRLLAALLLSMGAACTQEMPPSPIVDARIGQPDAGAAVDAPGLDALPPPDAAMDGPPMDAPPDGAPDAPPDGGQDGPGPDA